MVNQHSTQLAPHRAAALLTIKAAIDAAYRPAEAAKQFFDGTLNDVQVHEQALLIDPLNGSPWIFIPPATCFEFVAEPSNSGTEHLRARTQAQLVFNSLLQGKKH